MSGNNIVKEPPRAPDGLRAPGRAAWVAGWALPWVRSADASAIEHFARLEDRAAALCEQLDRDGSTLTKPMQNSRGDLIGETRYPHPALAALRGVDHSLCEVRRSLGLDPVSRAKARLEIEDGPDRLTELIARRRERLGER
jgi:hypothetical protein